MKSFYSMFVLSLVVFLFQLSNQFQTSQTELPNWKQAKEPSDFVRPSAEPDNSNPNSDPVDAASSEANELSKWLDLKRLVLKQTNWIALKELKAISFSEDAFTTGRKRLSQLNCLSDEDLCQTGPTHVTCTIQNGYNSSDYSDDLHEHYHQHYYCSALTPSNVKFDRLSISCETKLDELPDGMAKLDEDGKGDDTQEDVQAEDIDRILVLKGSCYLRYTLAQVDNGLVVLKVTIAILCFLVALVVMVYTFSTCRSPEKGNRVFLTPFYFTRSNMRHIDSNNSIYY